jgi:hypothetical protein
MRSSLTSPSRWLGSRSHVITIVALAAGPLAALGCSSDDPETPAETSVGATNAVDPTSTSVLGAGTTTTDRVGTSTSVDSGGTTPTSGAPSGGGVNGGGEAPNTTGDADGGSGPPASPDQS